MTLGTKEKLQTDLRRKNFSLQLFSHIGQFVGLAQRSEGPQISDDQQARRLFGDKRQQRRLTAFDVFDGNQPLRERARRLLGNRRDSLCHTPRCQGSCRPQGDSASRR